MNRRTLILAALAAAAGALLWWAVIGNPQHQAQRAVAANAGQVVAEQRGQGAKETTRIIERHFTEKHEIERSVADARAEIRASPDAAAVHAAGVRAVCLLSPPAGGAADPACALP